MLSMIASAALYRKMASIKCPNLTKIVTVVFRKTVVLSGGASLEGQAPNVWSFIVQIRLAPTYNRNSDISNMINICTCSREERIQTAFQKPLFRFQDGSKCVKFLNISRQISFWLIAVVSHTYEKQKSAIAAIWSRGSIPLCSPICHFLLKQFPPFSVVFKCVRKIIFDCSKHTTFVHKVPRLNL
jgi:hypothetical protein